MNGCSEPRSQRLPTAGWHFLAGDRGDSAVPSEGHTFLLEQPKRENEFRHDIGRLQMPIWQIPSSEIASRW